MHPNSPPGEGKLFVVPRATLPSPPRREKRRHPFSFAGDTLLLLAVIFLAVLGVAGCLAADGNWAPAKDFLLIFLPPLSALMGAAVHSRS